MLRKKLSVGVAVLIGAQLIAVACYVSTSRTCPQQANRGTDTCTLYSGSSYPWVTTGAQGYYKAKSDGTPHCEYQCPDGSFFWAYPGAAPTVSGCPGP